MLVEIHPTSPRIVYVLGCLLLLLASGCNPAATPPGKVLVVNARGLAYEDLLRYVDTVGAQKFFNPQLKEQIQALVPITNAVTISNIASFETGTLPSEHGIIGHTFALRAGDSIQAVSGFSQHFAVEIFWERAATEGKKVLNVGALILHGKYDQIENVDCLAQGQQLNNSQFISLHPAPIQGQDSLLIYEFSGTSSAAFKDQNLASVMAYEILSEQPAAALVLDDDLDIANGYIGRLKKGQWLEMEQKLEQNRKTAFRLQYAGKQQDTIELYARATYQNRGYPPNFLTHIDQTLGAAKGWPNTGAYAAGSISSESLVQEINEEIDFVIEGLREATQVKDYDLILLDYPLMDRYGHAFLNEFDHSEKIQNHYQAAFNRMDQDFHDLQQFALENGYEFILASGHGFSPIHTSINPNLLLQQAGINTDQENPDWEAVGMAGKVAAHIYLNPRLAEKDKKELKSEIEDIFQNTRTPTTQLSFVERIFEQDQLAEIGHNHPNAGDLFVLLKPGFVFQNGGEEIFGIPVFKGDHGFSPHHPSATGVLIADSPCDPCHSTDIAKVVIEKLKLD